MSLREPGPALANPWAVEALSDGHRRLLGGPPPDRGPESYRNHLARLGPLPLDRVSALVAELERSGLRGRGGAAFPVGTKWRAIAERPRRARAVVLANGAEGEPASAKDRILMAARPHLVIDGAILAAATIGAREVVFYVGREHDAAVRAIGQAMTERADTGGLQLRLVTAPISYVAGESTAAVHYVNDGDARPTSTPPRVSERGVNGRPTLVQNVESLAYAALIARFGASWYRSAGRNGAVGTGLVTIAGPVARPGVYEIELGTPLREVLLAAGGMTEAVSAIALGGYFGSWAVAAELGDVQMDQAALAERGLSFGCGLIMLLPAADCGVRATASIMSFMARSSAGQCGPCVLGLDAIAGAVERIAAGVAEPTDLGRIESWTALLAGRGACRHPDGAAQLMSSALDVFAADFGAHANRGRCQIASVAEDAA